MGTAAVAAIILRKERRAVEAFARGGATSPAAAQSLEALGIPDGLAVQRLRDHAVLREGAPGLYFVDLDRKSTRLNSSHPSISYAVFCLKKKTNTQTY